MTVRPELPDEIREGRIIPVARRLDKVSAPKVSDALVQGGIRVLEVTMEAEGSLEALSSLHDNGILTGVGTVVSVSQAEVAIEAGAKFIVSPHLDISIVEWALSRSICVIPGSLTPTEVVKAWRSGVPAVKLFPASVGGPGLVRALLGPFPDLQLIPTGGINDENVSAFLAAGAVAVGVGGWLTSQDSGRIRERAVRLAQITSKEVPN